jgi:hypothetical protein
MEDQVTPAQYQPIDQATLPVDPTDTVAPVAPVPVTPVVSTPAPAPAPLRIDIQAQPIRTTKVVLVAEDFGPNEPAIIGIALTCRTDFPFGVRKRLISLVSAGRKRDGSVDVEAQMEVLTSAEVAIASIVQEWNLDNGGVPMSISVESLDLLPDPIFNAVAKGVGKALSQGSLDPNSARS